MLAQPVRRAGDALERVGERRQVELAGVGQQQGAVEAAEELQPQDFSRLFTWWLMAACVTCSSSAALVKLRCRPAASKARRAVSGGIWRAMFHLQ